MSRSNTRRKWTDQNAPNPPAAQAAVAVAATKPRFRRANNLRDSPLVRWHNLAPIHRASVAQAGRDRNARVTLGQPCRALDLNEPFTRGTKKTNTANRKQLLAVRRGTHVDVFTNGWPWQGHMDNESGLQDKITVFGRLMSFNSNREAPLKQLCRLMRLDPNATTVEQIRQEIQALHENMVYKFQATQPDLKQTYRDLCTWFRRERPSYQSRALQECRCFRCQGQPYYDDFIHELAGAVGPNPALEEADDHEGSESYSSYDGYDSESESSTMHMSLEEERSRDEEASQFYEEEEEQEDAEHEPKNNLNMKKRKREEPHMRTTTTTNNIIGDHCGSAPKLAKRHASCVADTNFTTATKSSEYMENNNNNNKMDIDCQSDIDGDYPDGNSHGDIFPHGPALRIPAWALDDPVTYDFFVTYHYQQFNFNYSL